MKKYQDRFVNVISFIEANLDIDLDIEKLCQLAYLSKYHFHRQCSVFFGMPIMSIVKILRLKRAAYQLAYRNEKIVNIALANGYESHEGFSRAFKKNFNQSPSDFRRSPDWTLWHTKYEPILNLRIKIMNNNVNFETKIVDFPKTLIATIEHRAAPNLIGITIKKFIEWRKENQLPPSKSKTFNLVYDDPNITAPENYRFDVCCSIDHAIEENTYGIVNKVIPAGKCAVVRHIGSDDSIGLVLHYLYSEWLNNSNFEVRDFPIFFDRVSFFPEVPENEMITDVYLPIA
jgi:AraC family transcriptional regulator